MAELNVTAEGEYTISGDVSLSDIARMGQLPELAGKKDVLISLANVRSADSAIAALLLQWLRQSKDNAANFSVTGCPDSVRLLLNLYDLEPIVGV